jgi:putative membrane protein
MSQTSNSDSLIRLVIVIAAVLILGPLVLMLLAAPLMGGMMMLGMPGAGGFFIFGILAMFLLPLLLIVAGVVVYRRWNDREREDEALRELRTAFARGEIDREEFEERRDALTEGGRQPTERQRGDRTAERREERGDRDDRE